MKRSSPPPTPRASPWCSRACATFGIRSAKDWRANYRLKWLAQMAGSERRSRSAVTCPAAPRPARAGAPSAPANSARRAIASSAKPGSDRGLQTLRLSVPCGARTHTPFPFPAVALAGRLALPSSVTVKRSSPKSRKVAVAIRCRRRRSCQGSIEGRGRKKGTGSRARSSGVGPFLQTAPTSRSSHHTIKVRSLPPSPPRSHFAGALLLRDRCRYRTSTDE